MSWLITPSRSSISKETLQKAVGRPMVQSNHRVSVSVIVIFSYRYTVVYQVLVPVVHSFAAKEKKLISNRYPGTYQVTGRLTGKRSFSRKSREKLAKNSRKTQKNSRSSLFNT